MISRFLWCSSWFGFSSVDVWQEFGDPSLRFFLAAKATKVYQDPGIQGTWWCVRGQLLVEMTFLWNVATVFQWWWWWPKKSRMRIGVASTDFSSGVVGKLCWKIHPTWSSPSSNRCCQQDLQICAAACLGSAEDWGRSLFRHERVGLSLLPGRQTVEAAAWRSKRFSETHQSYGKRWPDW